MSTKMSELLESECPASEPLEPRSTPCLTYSRQRPAYKEGLTQANGFTIAKTNEEKPDEQR